MAKRKSTGKALRFEVFKRDGFTCQYCGAQSSDTLLVVDHIEPVATGGVTEIHNLITACVTCNQGKGAHPLGDRIVRPDADVMYLETQQEIAELRRYQLSVDERERATAALVNSLQEAWATASGKTWAPSAVRIRNLVQRYGIDAAYDALVDVAGKIGTGYLSEDPKQWVGYLNAVARNMVDEPVQIRPAKFTACELCDATDQLSAERFVSGVHILCPDCHSAVISAEPTCDRCDEPTAFLAYVIAPDWEKLSRFGHDSKVCPACYREADADCRRFLSLHPHEYED